MVTVEPHPYPLDGRQSEIARDIARGATRCLSAHGFMALPEVTIATGRRVDLMAASRKSDIWVIEIKSSLADFKSDQKWSDYRAHCDQFFFAVQPDFPIDVLPDDTGLILADRYGGELIRHPTTHPLAAARRKALLTIMATTATARLTALADPDAAADLRLP